MAPFFATRWKKIILFVAVLLVIAPFVLLHVAFLWMKWSEPKLKDVTTTTLATTNGLSLRIYSRLSPHAHATLLFVHGSPATARAFHKQFDEDFPDLNLVAYDRPGYGGSSSPASFDLKSQVEALGYLLRSGNFTNCILIGHSYGGPVALQAAITFSNQVKGVILIGGSIDPSQEKVMIIQRIGNLPLIRLLLPSALRHCNQELLPLKTDLLALQPRLKDLQSPILMLHGGKDPLVPVANVAFVEREMNAANHGALFSKLVIPEYNHFIPWEHPAAVHSAIDEILPRALSH